MPTVTISRARTRTLTRSAVRARPSRGCRAPEPSARPTPANSANRAAECPENNRQDQLASPVCSFHAGSRWMAMSPISASPRAASIPTSRRLRGAPSVAVATSPVPPRRVEFTRPPEFPPAPSRGVRASGSRVACRYGRDHSRAMVARVPSVVRRQPIGLCIPRPARQRAPRPPITTTQSSVLRERPRSSSPLPHSHPIVGRRRPRLDLHGDFEAASMRAVRVATPMCC